MYLSAKQAGDGINALIKEYWQINQNWGEALFDDEEEKFKQLGAKRTLLEDAIAIVLGIPVNSPLFNRIIWNVRDNNGFLVVANATSFPELDPAAKAKLHNDGLLIVAAAIQIEKDGHRCVLAGKRHDECFRQLATLQVKRPWKEIAQGFITSDFQFLTRSMAKQLAIKNGQLVAGTEEFPSSAELYSEDLW